jgi:hypothetical protein
MYSALVSGWHMFRDTWDSFSDASPSSSLQARLDSSHRPHPVLRQHHPFHPQCYNAVDTILAPAEQFHGLAARPDRRVIRTSVCECFRSPRSTQTEFVLMSPARIVCLQLGCTAM